MSQQILQFIDLFKAIFGGKINTGDGSMGIITVKASPILLTGFILGVLAIALLLFIFVSYRNNLLNKKPLTIISVVAITFFVASAVLFLFRDASIRNQFADTMRTMGMSEEEIKEGLKEVTFDMGANPVIFIVTQFIAAASLTGALLIEKFKRI